jgi:hypothetical protein
MFKLSDYYRHTPAKWRKIGDGLLAASTFVTATSIIGDYHAIGMIALIVGATGKFLTNFFAEKK